MKQKLIEGVNAALAAMRCLPHELTQGVWNSLVEAGLIISGLPDDTPPSEFARYRERVRALLLAVARRHREMAKMAHPRTGPKAGRECAISGILPALARLRSEHGSRS